jgi:membrane-associated protease RseP (regulator of RpoE activity)
VVEAVISADVPVVLLKANVQAPLPALVKLMLPGHVAVKLVEVPVSQMTPAPMMVQKAPGFVMVLVPVPELEKDPIWGLLLLKFRVPPKAPIVSESTSILMVMDTVPPPELASKVTSSDDVGTDAPAVPPEVAAQCVVAAASHVPAPPTQNRLAIGHPVIKKAGCTDDQQIFIIRT